nr:replicative helicase loader/inhibitor [uncultured Oscillibacter sp.]
MNRAEMTEIFAVLMIAYPNAEMFKAPDQQALKEKLAPTITLWTTCLRDIDFWTAQQAVVRVCRTCKFPPTIAEMREAAETVLKEIQGEIDHALLMACQSVRYRREGETLESVYEGFPARTKKAIEAMGGMEAFAPPDSPMFNRWEFERTYERLLRSNPIGLPGETGGQKKLK